jgi:hypothetical protein
MKKITFLLLTFLTALQTFSQTPQAINYQAVARNAQGLIIPAQNINIRFSIIDGSVSGTVLYQETQSATTNNYGLFTLSIGKGTAVTGTFAGVNWGSGTDKFLKVEIASSAGGGYDLQGTTQLLSVPYALYSEKTKLISGNGINITNGNTISGAYTAGAGINIVGPVISGAYTGGTGISVTGSTISHNLQAGTGINITGPTISGAYTAGTGVNITGATISGAYTAGTGINITGGTISGAYQAGNAISITGNTIAANYSAGTGINITGSTISHNLVAGTGVNITGNVISAPGSTNYWLPNANGIYYSANHVGIGTTPQQYIPLTVQAVNTDNTGHAILHLRSTDTWHSSITIFNGASGSANEKYYSLILAGPTNSGALPGTFGLFNHQSLNWSYNFSPTTNYMAIGSSSFTANTAKSRLHVFLGDVNIDQIGSGIIMKSPNGQCWRITIDNTGTLIRTAITCP